MGGKTLKVTFEPRKAWFFELQSTQTLAFLHSVYA